MKKRIFAMMITCLIVLTGSTGCRNTSIPAQPEESSENDSESDSEEQLVEEYSSEEQSLEEDNSEDAFDYGEEDTDQSFFSNDLGECTFNASEAFKNDFSNGYIWISFTDESGYEKYGLIDKNGKMKFYMEGIEHPGVVLDNGKSYFSTMDGKYYSVTTDGIVSQEFENVNGSELIRDDYYCFSEKVNGFDTDQLKYYIYNPDGKLIKELTYESGNFPDFVLYHGSGVFEFYHNFYSGSDSVSFADFYCSKDDVFVQNQARIYTDYIKSYYNEGSYMLYYQGYDNDNKPFFTIMDNKGNWKDIYIPSDIVADGCGFMDVDTSDYGILFRNTSENYYFIYDVKKDIFKKFDGEYAERIHGGAMIGNESLGFSLEGKDGNSYAALYDIETFDLLCEPIREEYSSSTRFLKSEDNYNYKPVNDYYYIADDGLNNDYGFVCNKNGETIKTMSNRAEVKYSDGVYCCTREDGLYDETVHFYDDNFNLLFTSESIDSSEAILIEY